MKKQLCLNKAALLRAFVILVGMFVIWSVAPGQLAQGQTFTVIHRFTGGTDGQYPNAGLTLDEGGNLYGTAGPSLVFRLKYKNAGWTMDQLYEFKGAPDGYSPVGRPVFGPNGSLYGATFAGGAPNCDDGMGCGSLYNLRPSGTACKAALCPWTEGGLYSFPFSPNGDPVFDSTGNFYVTGLYSGGNGAVFQVTFSNGQWMRRIIYNFLDPQEGGSPQSGVIIDNSGNIYGSMSRGGDPHCNGQVGCGTIFELIPSGSGWIENTIYVFHDGVDGRNPIGGLILDSAGNLYGSASEGGANGGGTVFQLHRSGGQWNFKLLYSFTGGTFDSGPVGPLFLDGSGDLYGLTLTEGAFDQGTLFRLTPSGDSWLYSDLHDFSGGPNDGSYPYGNPILNANGNVFGTAAFGGGGGCGSGCGVVWEVVP